MRLPLKWLHDYVSLNAGPAEIADALDSAGFEVERVTRLDDGTAGVVAARVQAIEPHPDADRLRVCIVDSGGSTPATVVCGASNFEVGAVVPFAAVGSELPGGLVIARRKIRGVVSEGMICSEEELGLGTGAEGIMTLAPEGSPESWLGVQIAEVLGLDETVIEFDITPNRPDAMSIFGLAREAAAAFGVSFELPQLSVNETGQATSALVEVENLAPDRCPRYTARVVEGVTIGPSPAWIVARLTAAGIRSVNNVVDITNFVLIETGQPLHAFDLDLISGGRIVVRRATSGEDFTTLDGLGRKLTNEDLVIADAEVPTALAGVMGGMASEISDSTVRVLIESAYFEPVGILKTSKRTGLRTESSSRFERGCDPGMAEWASNRAVTLIAEVAGGRISSGLLDDYPEPIERRQLTLRPTRTNRILGTSIDWTSQAAMLDSIDLEVLSSGPEMIEVSVPTFRPDLEREIDLVEEIARLHGYSNISPTLPESKGRVGRLSRAQQLRRRVSSTLRAAGLSEAQTFSFVGPDDLLAPLQTVSRVANPLRAEESILRPSLLPGLLRVGALNLARRKGVVRLFESGRVFGGQNPEGIPAETARIAGIIVSEGVIPEPGTYSAIKGIVETLLDSLGIEGAAFVPAERPGMHPGRTAQLTVSEMPVGILAELQQGVAERLGIGGGGAVFEIDESAVLDAAAHARPFREFSRYPIASVDLAFVVDEVVPVAAIEAAIRDACGNELESCRLFDVFRGEQVGIGTKSAAFALGFSSLDHTLRDDEVAALRERAIDAAKRDCGAELRG